MGRLTFSRTDAGARGGRRRRNRGAAAGWPTFPGTVAASMLAVALALGGGSLGLPARAAAQNAGGGAEDAAPGRFGFGRTASAEEIAAWDIDVMPDGAGLPEGEGTAMTGGPTYARQCAVCHGQSGEGGIADRLVGYTPESTPPFGPRYEEWRGDGPDVPYSIGNYWPYATTLFDYIRRAMPTNAPGTLEADQVYEIGRAHV